MEQFFYNFGLDKKETQCLIKLIELGAQPVSVLAKQLSMPRSTVYSILDRLRELRLVEFFERYSVRYVKAIDVNKIKDLITQKKVELNLHLKLYQKSLPQLLDLQNRLSITPIVKFYEGVHAVESMYKNILNLDRFSAIQNAEKVKQYMPKFYLEIPTAIKKRGISAKELVVSNQIGQEYLNQYNSQNHQIKLLPTNTTFNSDTIITEDRIYMVSYGENDLSAVEIWNTDLATTQLAIFDQLWG